MNARPPVVGVFALQGDVREHVRALAACGAVAHPVRRPAELDDVDGLVIPGGESTTMSKLAVEFGLFDPIAKRIADGMPVYGSCAGMILLATTVLDGRPDQRSFGAIDMTVRRNAFGRQVDSFEGAVEISGLAGEPFHAVFIRAPWVESVGDEVEVLGTVARSGPDARSGAAEVGAAGSRPEVVAHGSHVVAVRHGSAIATSFHPELTGDLRLHELFVTMVRKAA